jgi:lysylphosphatidylglycerol synthetase-like protein (DUF2156 family)
LGAAVSDARVRLVETVLPLTVVETSHFIGSIDGVLLLLFAYGIQQRLRWAWALSAVLLCAGAVSCAPPSLAHTDDDREFEEADRLAGGGERRESG